MYPDKEMLRRWSFCHRQPSCWSVTSEPMLKVVTAVPAAASQSFTVLSPEAEISWELSGLQLICVFEERCTKLKTHVNRGCTLGVKKLYICLNSSKSKSATQNWKRMVLGNMLHDLNKKICFFFFEYKDKAGLMQSPDKQKPELKSGDDARMLSIQPLFGGSRVQNTSSTERQQYKLERCFV